VFVATGALPETRTNYVNVPAHDVVVERGEASSGELGRVRVALPDGSTWASVALRPAVRPAGSTCKGDEAVDVRAEAGGTDPLWHTRSMLQGFGWLVRVPVDEAASRLVLSVTVDGPKGCRYTLEHASAYVRTGQDKELSFPLLMGAAALVIVGVFLIGLSFIHRSRLRERRLLADRGRIRAAEQELEDALRSRPPRPAVEPVGPVGPVEPVREEPEPQDGLVLPALWELTHARLEDYHRIAMGQAARSFRNAQIAMATGFVLLVAFTVLALMARTTAASIVAGALGVTSAGLAGYVSRTFVRSQEIAAGHLRAYFDQPLEFSRYLAAERLIADAELSGEQRAGILAEVVRAMVASGAQGGPGGGPGARDPDNPAGANSS
jgi:hypothetical protein